jgi:holliday junction DNA helicase RuvA
MIGYLQGELMIREPTLVLIDVHGVGYEVRISLNTYSDIKNLGNARLFTHLQVKEDAHVLYGFSTEAEKSMFLHLISVSGIGPGTALTIVSSMTVSELRTAILHEDVAAIQRVKGVGSKTAQRLILDLSDRLRKGGDAATTTTAAGRGSDHLRTESLAALLTLGIPKAAAEKSVDAVLTRHGSDITLEELIKQVLKGSS